ncbi:MAG: TspO/MBR family protein [archaeon]
MKKKVRMSRVNTRNVSRSSGSKKVRWLAMIVCIAIPLFAGFIGSFFTSSNIPVWYEGLNKPSFTPPAQVFPVVWTTLFVLMGIALYIVYVSPKGKTRTMALRLFGIQLGLNIIWSILFFGMRRPEYALIEIVLLWISILMTMIYFRKVDRKTTGYLLLYIIWVSVASVLNYTIVALNP